MKRRIAHRIGNQSFLGEREDGPPADAELRVRCEVLKAPFEVVRMKGDVAVELGDKVPCVMLDTSEASVEGVHHTAAGDTMAAVGTVDDFDPGMTGSVRVDDRAGIVFRAIVDDDPLGRTHRLPHDRLQRLRDMRGLVADRRNDDIKRWGAHDAVQRWERIDLRR